MGPGWSDEAEAANAYADYLADQYRNAAHKRFPGHEVDVSIEVQNATGWSGTPTVFGDADTLEIAHFERDISDTEYWSQWCESDDAPQYLSDED